VLLGCKLHCDSLDRRSTLPYCWVETLPRRKAVLQLPLDMEDTAWFVSRYQIPLRMTLQPGGRAEAERRGLGLYLVSLPSTPFAIPCYSRCLTRSGSERHDSCKRGWVASTASRRSSTTEFPSQKQTFPRNFGYDTIRCMTLHRYLSPLNPGILPCHTIAPGR
jgi:hypothetical protein